LTAAPTLIAVSLPRAIQAATRLAPVDSIPAVEMPTCHQTSKLDQEVPIPVLFDQDLLGS
jgi:hypothetical protein